MLADMEEAYDGFNFSMVRRPRNVVVQYGTYEYRPLAVQKIAEFYGVDEPIVLSRGTHAAATTLNYPRIMKRLIAPHRDRRD